MAGFVRCFFGIPDWWVSGILMVPMVADGFVQLLTPYESTNPRRFVTGLLFGWGFCCLVALAVTFMFTRGQAAGAEFWGSFR